MCRTSDVRSKSCSFVDARSASPLAMRKTQVMPRRAPRGEKGGHRLGDPTPTEVLSHADGRQLGEPVLRDGHEPRARRLERRGIAGEDDHRRRTRRCAGGHRRRAPGPGRRPRTRPLRERRAASSWRSAAGRSSIPSGAGGGGEVVLRQEGQAPLDRKPSRTRAASTAGRSSARYSSRGLRRRPRYHADQLAYLRVGGRRSSSGIA